MFAVPRLKPVLGTCETGIGCVKKMMRNAGIVHTNDPCIITLYDREQAFVVVLLDIST